ncbi:MAG: septal ring lytic transglycosylase RlpA family protein [Alphaproteobacteria bacterium]|nr:septal ring lytic transglycosylase RlpA family protein [Alphaproteobacteria bacterium]
MVGQQHFWRGVRGLTLMALAAVSLAACATPTPRLDIGHSVASSPRGPMTSPSGKPLRGTEKPYQIKGTWYYPQESPDYDVKGIGSWYGEQFHNRRTSNGEIFDMNIPSAAHKTLPLPCLVEVTNLDNGRKMLLRVNDRGPFVGDRVIDLSRAAAEQLGYRRQGVARVRVRYVGPASKSAFEPRQYAQAPAAPAPPPKPEEAVNASEPAWPAEPPPVRTVLVAPRATTFKVQAGAFSSRENAERAVAQLKAAGWATIEPMMRASGTLYRVVVAAGEDEGSASTLRERVVALGYSGATVLHR